MNCPSCLLLKNVIYDREKYNACNTLLRESITGREGMFFNYDFLTRQTHSVWIWCSLITYSFEFGEVRAINVLICLLYTTMLLEKAKKENKGFKSRIKSEMKLMKGFECCGVKY